MIKFSFLFHILFLSFVLSSCGTLIKDSADYISVDSQLRASRISDQDAHLMGETPFIYKIERRRIQDFTLQDEYEKINLSYNCQLDWVESIIPDLITTAVIFPVGALSLGVDWGFGTLYKCKKPAFFYNKGAGKNLNYKRDIRILLIPPSTGSYQTSNFILKNYQSLTLKSNSNIEFIRLDDDLAALEISPYSDNSLKKINQDRLYPLYYKYKITHLLYFQNSSQENDKKLKPVIVDVFNQKELPIKLSEIDISENKLSITESIIDKIHFIPNAFKIGNSQLSSGDTLVSIESHPKSFPKYISAFTFGYVYSPYKYDSWDFDYYTTPTFSLPAWKNTYNNQTYLFQSITGAANGGILLKSPFGAINAELGIGGIYFFQKPGVIKNKLQLMIDVSLSYTFYFSKKVFFYSQIQFFSPSKTTIDTQKIQIQQAMIGLGFYMPELENLFHERILNN
jgi:hypothetical protein